MHRSRLFSTLAFGPLFGAVTVGVCSTACETQEASDRAPPGAPEESPSGSVGRDASSGRDESDEADTKDAAAQREPPISEAIDASKPTDGGARAPRPMSQIGDAAHSDADVRRPGSYDASRPTAPADAGASEGGPMEERCGVAALPAGKLPRELSLSGSLAVHDPTIIESDGTYYLWSTGPRLPAKTSRDLMRWTDAPSAFGARNPAWIAEEVPEATDLWAPDVARFGGQFHLYYSASKLYTNSSCIGHAVRDSLASGSWIDKGPVICSNRGSRDDWNAIDPNVVIDEEGKPWLSFGSFWSGIKAVELDASGARANDKLHSLARRGREVDGAVEAPFIIRRCGYYYLFVSFDKCCVGVDSTYNIRVGRSATVTGPYVDRAGVELMAGGGTPLVAGEGRFAAAGHNAVLFDGMRALNVYHAYDRDQSGRATLRISEMFWDDAGWPISAGP